MEPDRSDASPYRSARQARIPSPRMRREGFVDRVVDKARQQPKVRGGVDGRAPSGTSPSPPLRLRLSLPGCTTRCSRASPRGRGEGTPPLHPPRCVNA
ncbi:hypothetical protein FV229_14630 [Methylobacterium sp. WL120]|nr:hypothetical protein FV229_14630 [Methylobacterium sp. WL120]